jgi:acyl dehydratase
VTTRSPHETLDWRTIEVGTIVPELVLPMTPTRVVAGALATRDFMPVHHDRAYANAQGAPEIFMNIFSDAAYCSRFLTDWAGPEAMVRRLSIRLGVPAFAGSTLTFTGFVESVEDDAGAGRVLVKLTAANELGDHVVGEAVLEFPRRDP